MSMDLCLVNGYGIELNDLSWKNKEEVDAFLANKSESMGVTYYDYTDYIDNHLTTYLERATIASTSREYLYYGAIYPLKQNEVYLMTKEEMAKEIYQIMSPLVNDTEEDILKLLQDVFDWETC